MGAGVPLMCFLMFWLGFYRRGSSWHKAFLTAAVLWGACVYLLTELLSLAHAFSFWPLLSAWVLIFIGVLFFVRFKFSVDKISLCVQWPLDEKILFLLIVLLAGIKGSSALLSAPNTSDAMTYHLSRVEHWIQNKSIMHYPTAVLRQIYTAPWAEYAIAQLRILSGGDYCSNAVQWFSSIGSWVAIVGIMDFFSVHRRSKLLAVLCAATLPLGLVQATSTQNDYVLTFWVATALYFMWLLYVQPKYFNAGCAGAAVGLALLTKGNAYIFIPVILITYVLGAMIKRSSTHFKMVLIVIVLAAACILPYAVRNSVTFGKPHWTHNQVTNLGMSAKTWVSLITCNFAMHLNTPWPAFNVKIDHVLTGALERFGIDLHHPYPNDGPSFSFGYWSTGEDDTGNALYMVIFILALLAMPFIAIKSRHKLWGYGALVIVFFFLISGLVFFSAFNGRYQLTIFVLSCVLTGIVFESLLKRWCLVFAFILVFACWPWALACNEHPLIGSKSIFKTTRMGQYFSEQPPLEIPFSLVTKSLHDHQCAQVGLAGTEITWEYPWWVLLRQNNGEHFRFEHVVVDNPTNKNGYPLGAFTPCAVIGFNEGRTTLNVGTLVFTRIWFLELPQGTTSLFIPQT